MEPVFCLLGIPSVVLKTVLPSLRELTLFTACDLDGVFHYRALYL